MVHHRVRVTIEGVVRVEADNPKHAEAIAKRMLPLLDGNRLYGHKISTKHEGLVGNHTVHPNKMTHSQTGRFRK